MGSLAIRLAKRGFQATGLDVSSEALKLADEAAKKEHVSIEWKEGFAENIPFPNKSFDYVTCCHTLEHVRDLDATVKELKRVAREKIVILVPKQKFKLYADNYHTHFFETKKQLIDAMGMEWYRCDEIDCVDHKNEFQGEAFLFVGTLKHEKT